MNDRKRGKYIGLTGTIIVHLAFIALLLLLAFTAPEPMEESGVEVMMGNVESAYGGFDPSSLVDVDIIPQPEVNTTPAVVNPPSEQEMITQEDEETIAINAAKAREEEARKAKEAEEARAAEARRLAEEQAERERRAAAEAANNRVAGAFGRGAEMGSRGNDSGEGIQGTPTGNSSTGATTGSGGYGTFDLGGRSIGEGGLPRPEYNVQEEGRVVVTITVNPAGFVISTSINRLTNTVNPVLRKSAEDAAKKARFNVVDRVNNQTGTITYYFNLR